MAYLVMVPEFLMTMCSLTVVISIDLAWLSHLVLRTLAIKQHIHTLEKPRVGSECQSAETHEVMKPRSMKQKMLLTDAKEAATAWKLGYRGMLNQ